MMKEILLPIFLFFVLSIYAERGTTILRGREAANVVANSEIVRMKKYTKIPNYIKFKKDEEFSLLALENWLQHYFKSEQK